VARRPAAAPGWLSAPDLRAATERGALGAEAGLHAGVPVLMVLDARPDGLDEQQLRELARTVAATRRARAVSRSYCHPFALIAWHDDRVGVDIERVGPCDEAFGRSICTPSELASRPWEDAGRLISLWAGKEALAKALGEPLRHDPRRLEAPAGWPNGAAGRWRAREIAVADGYRAWVCWRCGPQGWEAQRAPEGVRSGARPRGARGAARP